MTVVHVPSGCSVGALAFYGSAAPAPGYLIGLPPAPPLRPPDSPASPPPAVYPCGPGTSVNAASRQCEITCDANANRRLADAGADAAGATADEIVDAYLREHPEFAAQVDDEMMMRHLRNLGEHFGVPALA